MSKDYIKVLYEKIHELNQIIGSYAELDDQTPYEDIILSKQDECNEIFDMIKETRARAVKQVCYNQLMIQNAIKDGRRSKDMKKYVFLTINPPDQLPYRTLVNSVQDFCDTVNVKWAYYVFEQRGENDGEYRGFHTHILFERDRRPSEVDKAIYRIFMPLVPDMAKIKMWSQDETKDIVNAFNYLKGKKQDGAKAPRVANDANMRRDFGLDAMYTVGEPPLLVGGSRGGCGGSSVTSLPRLKLKVKA